MKKVFKIIGGFSTAFILAIATMVMVQIDFSNDENFDVFIEKKMESLQAHGLALVFIKSGEITWSKNYGYADTEAEKKVTDESVFHIASLSKPVTGVAVMQLYEQGLIDLDASIDNYLPFKISTPHFPQMPITVRMLLQHKSSLIDNVPLIRNTFTILTGQPDPATTLGEFARAYYPSNGQWYDEDKNFSQKLPGEEYSYSNGAFALLGYMVEQVSGQPFNEYCRDNIFAPLDMKTAGWFSTEIDLENMAVQYDGGTRLKPYSYATYPAGALKISIRDYAKFMHAIMHGGVYNGHRILAESSVKEMLPENQTETLVWEQDVLTSEYLIDTKGQYVTGHSGGDPGTLGLVAFNPKTGNTFIFFMNGSYSLMNPWHLRMLNMPSFVKRIAKEAQLF
jgi:CubicO group peptidase (beta-lactamase class C family)